MAIIYSYPIKVNPTGGDTMIISDLDDRKLTKQITLAQLKPIVDTTYTFINKQDGVLDNTIDLDLTDSGGNTQTIQATGTGDITMTSLSNGQFTINSLGDKNFVFTQAIASDTWVVTHNLNKYCSVTITDNQVLPLVVIGNIKYDTLDQCTITFSAPFSGKAFCN